jgi:DNA-binding transcriptional regulator GbsR (MarR family)
LFGSVDAETVTTTPMPHQDSAPDWRRRFVEDMGGLILVHGTPRALMRVLGFMVVCEPADQTATDLQRELGLSAGSVSTSLRMLGDIGIVERVTRPRDRRIFYRLHPDGWELILEQRFRAFNEIRRVADRAVEAGGDEVGPRLTEMRDTWRFMEESAAKLLEASRARRATSSVPS